MNESFKFIPGWIAMIIAFFISSLVLNQVGMGTLSIDQAVIFLSTALGAFVVLESLRQSI
tara:strand:- start:672 stop:851 length:180 start_codon:yes stop_codon:yes gene_type:complete